MDEDGSRTRKIYEATMADLTLTSFSRKSGKATRVFDYKVAAAR